MKSPARNLICGPLWLVYLSRPLACSHPQSVSQQGGVGLVLGQDNSGQYFVLDLVPVACACACKTQSQQPSHLSLHALFLLHPSLPSRFIRLARNLRK
jgi:hypothetical protein